MRRGALNDQTDASVISVPVVGLADRPGLILASEGEHSLFCPHCLK